MDYTERITITPDKRSGKPCIRGTRMTGSWECETQQTQRFRTTPKAHGFVIVSKDSDFQARSLLYGHPPKFIWLRVGNCSVGPIEVLLRKQSVAIHTFDLNPTKSFLVLS